MNANADSIDFDEQINSLRSKIQKNQTDEANLLESILGNISEIAKQIYYMGELMNSVLEPPTKSVLEDIARKFDEVAKIFRELETWLKNNKQPCFIKLESGLRTARKIYWGSKQKGILSTYLQWRKKNPTTVEPTNYSTKRFEVAESIFNFVDAINDAVVEATPNKLL